MTWRELSTFSIAFGCALSCYPQAAASLTPPVLMGPVCSGLRELAGMTPLKAGRVLVNVNGREVGERTVTAGQFRIIVPELRVNQFVEVTFRYQDSAGKEQELRSSFDVSDEGACKPSETAPKTPGVAKVAEEKAVGDALSPVTIKALSAGEKKIAGTTPIKEGKITATIAGTETDAVLVKDSKYEIKLDDKKPLKENQEVAVTFAYTADGAEAKLKAKATVGPAPYTVQIVNTPTVAGPGVKGKDTLTVRLLQNGMVDSPAPTASVVESYSLNPDGEKSELLGSQALSFNNGEATATFEGEKAGGLYAVKAKVGEAIVTGEWKDPSAGIVARGVSEGDDSLTARMPKDTEKVEVIVAAGDVKQNSKTSEILDATYDPKKRIATLDYPNRFAEGQGIGFIAKDKDGKVIARSEGLLVEPSGYDWGRVKAYFSLGSVLAQSEGKFQNLAPYLRFNMEYNFVPFRNIVPVVVSRENRTPQSEIAMRVYRRANAVQIQRQTSEKRKEELVNEALRRQRNWHFALTGYADAQLTENPVATKSDATKPLTLNLRQSPTSGYFEYGIYMPVSAPMMQWTFKNLDNALYVAPLAKFGFMTVSNKVNEGQASTSVQTSAAAGTYKFYAAGFRVGHFSVKNDPNNAPENISFVDLAIGRYGVFRWRKDPSTIGSPEIYPTRVDIRGNFKIPATPFFLGLGANMGAGPDDLRILFGVRMNLAKLFGTVIPKL